MEERGEFFGFFDWEFEKSPWDYYFCLSANPLLVNYFHYYYLRFKKKERKSFLLQELILLALCVYFQLAVGSSCGQCGQQLCGGGRAVSAKECVLSCQAKQSFKVSCVQAQFKLMSKH